MIYMNALLYTIIIILAAILTIVSMLYMSSVCFEIREECIEKCRDCNKANMTGGNLTFPFLNVSAVNSDQPEGS